MLTWGVRSNPCRPCIETHHETTLHVPDATQLEELLHRIDGRGYKAYKDIAGSWSFPDFELCVDHVQGDPFAAPSRVHVDVHSSVAGLPETSCRTGSRTRGTAAHLADRFAQAAGAASQREGSGKSGEIRMAGPGQQVLQQTAVLVGDDCAIEARFTVGLPAQGRRVMGRAAVRLLVEAVPALVRRTLIARAHDLDEIERWAATNEDADAIRDALSGLDLVAFVADEASLPRRTGVDDRPLGGPSVVPFRSPGSLRVEVDTPNAGPIRGMGVRRGVTLIVGGGFHGKSTLLRALEFGVYNHRPGDGRERVITAANAVKIRAEDGRSVAGVDISGFIDNLPLDQDTRSFSTPNASGSTSQAASIVEALEAGAGTLLVDEDTSATNFMIRDRRMQELVPKDGEPITPFIDRVRELSVVQSVSSVLVLGGSGDYLDVADTVIAMRDYLAEEVSERAKAVAEKHPTGRRSEEAAPFVRPTPRTPDPTSVDASRGRREVSIRVPDTATLLFGEEEVDLSAVEQLVARGQVTAIGQALALARQHIMGEGTTLPDMLGAVEKIVAEGGLDALDSHHPGDLAGFRRFELGAALNRLRSLRVL